MAMPGNAVDGKPWPVPRATYIHVPFCAHRCGYCNFSVVARRNDLQPRYLGAIARELSLLETPRPVDTLYLGGGTPSQLGPTNLAELLACVLGWHPLAVGGELTVEANPLDVTPELVAVCRDFGTTRVSLGGQSFQRRKLAVLERDHQASDIERAIDRLHSAGIAVALDLIFGVPDESMVEWELDLRQAVALGPEHISTYGLTYERGSRFYGQRLRGVIDSVAESCELDMYLTAIDTLGAADFEHYEVSNFARPNQRSRHNEAYWAGQRYWAAGPGAARFVANVRETNHGSTTRYLQRIEAGQSPVALRETLSAELLARERLVFGLRRLAGLELSRFQAETGYSAEQLAGPALGQMVDRGWLERAAGHLRLTRAGLVISDSLWPDLL